MALLTVLVTGAAFGTGVAVGVFLNEYDVVTAEQIRTGGRMMVGKVKSMYGKEEVVDETTTAVNQQT